jgi:uncharacterized oxidoreductase
MSCMFGFANPKKRKIAPIVQQVQQVHNEITNKTIMITGGSSGIGLAYTKALLALGNRVAIVSKSTAVDKANELKTLYPEYAANVTGIIGDVRNKTSMQSAFAEASAFSPTGVLDAVILNAGIDGGLFDLDNVLQTNLTGVVYGVECYMYQITNELLNAADVSKDFQIIITGSIASFIPCDMNLCPAYDSSKAGVAQFVRGMRPVSTRYNFRINAVCPAGMVRTNLTAPYMDTPEKMAGVLAYQNAEGRGGIMEPEQIVPGMLEVLSNPSYNEDLITVQPNLGYPYRLKPRDPAKLYTRYGIYDERDSPSTKQFIDYAISTKYMINPFMG